MTKSHSKWGMRKATATQCDSLHLTLANEMDYGIGHCPTRFHAPPPPRSSQLRVLLVNQSGPLLIQGGLCGGL